MKKKIMAVVVAAMMICVMMVTASAAPSPSVSEVPSATAVTASGAAVEVTITAVTAEKAPAALKEAHREIVAAASVDAFLESVGVEVKEENLAVQSIFDVEVDVQPGEVVKVTFAIPSVKSGDVVVVLHKGDNGWESLPVVVADGSVTATFADFSPVVILTQSDAPAGDVQSPQTGDMTSVVLACGILVFAVAVAFSLKRRAEA